ncbi:hypothetical protein [Pontimicrobium sp. MEBiC06410]
MIKFLFILLIYNINNSMDNIEFEKFLGKDFLVFEETIRYDFKKYVEEGTYYLISFNETKKFYNLPYRTLSVQKNEKNTIKAITIISSEIINRKIFDLINAQYGKPNIIQVIANRTLENETISKDENGNSIDSAKKYSLDLKDGKFEDNPFLIVWENKEYQIQALLNQKQGRSSIKFSKVD